MPNESANLAGKSIVITGGARGIGLSIALSCRAAGAHVTVMARSQTDLVEAQRMLAQVSGNGRSLALQGDVSSDADLFRVYTAANEAFGDIYGLICAAGIYGVMRSFTSCEFADWEKTISINLLGAARSIHAALPMMKEGRIILFSGGGQGPMVNFSDYVASKGAIWRLTETLGAELAPRKIYVNAVAPGAVNTRLLDDLLAAGPEQIGEDLYKKSIQQQASGGQGSQKASELCLYLLSDRSAGLYGKTLSAVWDQYQNLQNFSEISPSDLFCYRRVVDLKGGTREAK